MSSLVGSIFGGGEEKKSNDVFEASSSLPAKPQHKKVPRPIKKKQLSKKLTIKREKRRKRNEWRTNDTLPTNNDEDDDDNSTMEEAKKEEEKKKKDDSAVQEDEKKKDDSAVQEDESDKPSTTTTPASADDRTIFVGNLPLDTTRKSLAALFRDCGTIESTRLRSIATSGLKVVPGSNPEFVKKISANTSKGLDTTIKTNAQGYVVFVHQDSVQKACLEHNNKSIGRNHILRVDTVSTNTMDPARTVFVGNLPYKTDEPTLRQHFCQGCELRHDEIENVRIVRDRETAQCKGFGYVLFSTREMVSVALRQMHDSIYKKKAIRVTVCGKRFKKKKQKEVTHHKTEAVGALQRILQTQGKNRHTNIPTPGKPSRRQAAEAKLQKRHKKLQKRVTKGMGKMKHR